jgi:hypothetical protein
MGDEDSSAFIGQPSEQGKAGRQASATLTHAALNATAERQNHAMNCRRILVYDRLVLNAIR